MRRVISIFLGVVLFCRAQAQDSTLLNMLNDSLDVHKGYVTGTFKASHVINMQTVESSAAGALSFV
ncbi:MAG TPA: hypothetical protein VIM64_00195, partial [Puia sp.]